MSWMWTNSNQGLNVLLIVTDGELQVTGNDTLLLVITSGIACQLENFGSKVLKDRCEVDCGTRPKSALDLFGVAIVQVLLTWCTSTDTLSVVALLQETVDTTDGELETRLRGARLRLGGGITGGLARLGLAAALARHCCCGL